MAMKSSRLWDMVKKMVKTVMVGNRVFMVEKLHKVNPRGKMVLVMVPSVQSSLKSVSLRDITKERKTKLNTSSKAALVMTPSVQSLLKLVSLREITLGRAKAPKSPV